VDPRAVLWHTVAGENAMRLEELGFDAAFYSKTLPEPDGGLAPARVIAVHKEAWVIQGAPGAARAEATGKLLYSAASPLDLPAVGDWVLAQVFPEQEFAVIHEVLPRKTVLTRKTPGKRIELQVIAANIDTAVIVQSLNADFNPRRLERYLAMACESRIRPLVLLSKSDLATEESREARLAAAGALLPGLEVSAFSTVTGHGLAEVAGLLSPGETFCLLGSSGVGKTTLLNRLLGEERLAVREVRHKDDKGRHTTSVRQLLRLPGGALLIDNPGMRELGNFDIAQGLRETFAEITSLASRCRYRDCTHVHETGCAVLAALAEGTLARERYESYMKLSKESDFQARSYAEKRRQDKDFGKMVKAFKRDFGRNRP
jgi:ribosome biogenesis GTPase